MRRRGTGVWGSTHSSGKFEIFIERMDWDESGPSPYQILGLGDEGPNATPDEIKKVIISLWLIPPASVTEPPSDADL